MNVSTDQNEYYELLYHNGNVTVQDFVPCLVPLKKRAKSLLILDLQVEPQTTRFLVSIYPSN